MDINKAALILIEAAERLQKEAGVPFAQSFSLSVPESAHPVFVMTFGETADACEAAVQKVPHLKRIK